MNNPRKQLDDLLNKLDNKFLTSENVLQELWSFSRKVCPKYLFRYRQVNEHSLADLRNKTATFSLAKSFDKDPDDCTLHDLGGLDQAVTGLISSNPKDDILRIRVTEIQERLKSINLGILRDAEAVLCLTDTPNSEYLWNTYIDGKGADFCIIYETTSLRFDARDFEARTFILPVIYRNSLPETNQLIGWLALCAMSLELQNLQAVRIGITNLRIPYGRKQDILRFLDHYETLPVADRKSVFEGRAYIDFVRMVFYKLTKFQDEAEWRVITPLQENESNPEHPIRKWAPTAVVVKDELPFDKLAAIQEAAQCPIINLNE